MEKGGEASGGERGGAGRAGSGGGDGGGDEGDAAVLCAFSRILAQQGGRGFRRLHGSDKPERRLHAHLHGAGPSGPPRTPDRSLMHGGCSGKWGALAVAVGQFGAVAVVVSENTHASLVGTSGACACSPVARQQVRRVAVIWAHLLITHT